ncbi:hypothetical protein FGO68_gene13513 [Halteria grandinella]|uniref:Uncharacterized protein n=1 Tax=Halteria grandinella TaxID=5974 RepID=A0A8J8NH92_HALGN|nr:hypothetical protein FGO68_gene13513 [Halteria grandinella]
MDNLGYFLTDWQYSLDVSSNFTKQALIYVRHLKVLEKQNDQTQILSCSDMVDQTFNQYYIFLTMQSENQQTKALSQLTWLIGFPSLGANMLSCEGLTLSPTYSFVFIQSSQSALYIVKISQDFQQLSANQVIYPGGLQIIINRALGVGLDQNYVAGYTNSNYKAVAARVIIDGDSMDIMNVTAKTGGIVIIGELVISQGLFLSKQMDLGVMQIGMRGIDVEVEEKYRGSIEFEQVVKEVQITVGRSPYVVALSFQYIGTCNLTNLTYNLSIDPQASNEQLIYTYNGTHLMLETFEATPLQTYVLSVTATLPFKSVSNSTTISIQTILPNQTIPNFSQILSLPPVFEAKLKTLSVMLGYQKVFGIPITTPKNGVKIIVNIPNDTAKFVQYDQNHRWLIFNPQVGNCELKEYDVEIILRSQFNGLSSQYLLTIKVMNATANITQIENATQNSTIEIPSSASGSEAPPPNWNFSTPNPPHKTDKLPFGKIRSISPQGLIRIGLRYQNGVQDDQKFVTEDYIFMKLEQSSDESFEELDWEYIDISEDKTLLRFQLKFDSSKVNKRSKIILCLLAQPQKSHLSARSKLMYCQDQMFIPIQIQTTIEYQQIQTIAKVVSTSIISFMASNLFISIIASSSLQLLWSFVNSLQLISFLPLMNLDLPPNMYYVLSLINGPMQFKLFDSDGMTSSLFRLENLSDGEPYNELFNEFGYTSNIAVLNLDNTFYILLLFPIHYIFWHIFKRLNKRQDMTSLSILGFNQLQIGYMHHSNTTILSLQFLKTTSQYSFQV